MLTVAEEHLKNHYEQADLMVFGHELNAETLRHLPGQHAAQGPSPEPHQVRQMLHGGWPGTAETYTASEDRGRGPMLAGCLLLTEDAALWVVLRRMLRGGGGGALPG